MIYQWNLPKEIREYSRRQNNEDDLRIQFFLPSFQTPWKQKEGVCLLVNLLFEESLSEIKT